MAITHDYVSWATGNDYKGASFTDGAFTVADMTLTKAGAFAASKANHWLYLDDNGSGEVTTGYYLIASVTSADAVVLAASPKSGANDPTDVVCTQHAGTTALPWRSDQGAVDLLTRNTTDGNQVNVKAGNAVVHAAALDLATFVAGGALAFASPLILRGYTATAGDGGIGEIDCGGASMFSSNAYDYIILADLKIHSAGDNNIVDLDNFISLIRCEVHKGASSPNGKYLVTLDNNVQVIGCYLHDVGTSGLALDCGQSSAISFNYISANTAAVQVYASTGSCLTNNICLLNHAGAAGIYADEPVLITMNVVYNIQNGTSYGIRAGCSSTNFGAICNNIACGFAGAGGKGIFVGVQIGFLGYNALWNNTTPVLITDQAFINQTANDVTLAADPFTDAANGDFSLTAAAKAALADKGWPTAYLGAHANTVPNLNIGPIQMAASTGGGVNMPRVRVGH